MGALPEGRAGQGLALLLTLAAAALLWFGVVAPGRQWYAARAERLAELTVTGQHMAALAAVLPDLRRRAAAAPPADEAWLLHDTSDALAAATLQARLEALAATAGANVASTETLPAAAAGTLRAVAVRATVSAPFPALIGLLRGMEDGTPAMVVDDLRLRPLQPIAAGADVRLEASFAVTAFRAGRANP